MPPAGQAWELGDFPASWLRANCQCSTCVDPGSGQRLVSILDQPADVRVADLGRDPQDGAVVRVRFEPDGHQGVFATSWLAAARQPALASRTEDAKRLWRAADFAVSARGDDPPAPPAVSALGDDPPDPPGVGLPQGRWERYLRDAEHRATCLASLLTDGFVLLREVPAVPGTVLAVARSMGFVRVTNYGELFDVRATVDPANLAFTELAIAPHTDNPYRDPVPTVQLLHCLASAAQGGDSGLVDGFAAASALRSESPSAFDVLASTPVTFAYADATAELRATMPIIGRDPRGRIKEVRWNSRSMRPLPLRSADADAFYGACRAFAAILARPEMMVTFRLETGDCLIFDNTRVLHARTAFAAAGGSGGWSPRADTAGGSGGPALPDSVATGHRHLQGCYADLDSVESTLAVLRRRVNQAAE